MHHRPDAMTRDDVGEQLGIPDVALIERYFRRNEAARALRQIVQHNSGVARRPAGPGRMTADVAGAAGTENRVFCHNGSAPMIIVILENTRNRQSIGKGTSVSFSVDLG